MNSEKGSRGKGENRYDEIFQQIKEADAVVIGAGAGLSTSGGLEYAGKRFERLFPDFIARYGLSDMYSSAFYPFATIEERWAYMSRHVMCNRFEAQVGQVYKDLLEAVSAKEYFVLTTNADHQFYRAGFDSERIFATQGDYGEIQCSKGCHDVVYDNEAMIHEMVVRQVNCRIPSELVPKCPVCGEDMDIHLRKTLENQNIPIRTTPMDEKGLITELLPSKASKLIFTTPSHQFPTGAVMHISRRIQLIQYAREHDCYIVEDDYDSEFRYEGEPIQSLQNLDPERIVYIGTFSKTFCPAVRMGYMIVPVGLIDVIQNAKYNADIHSALFEQMAMADFMDGGHYERHIRKMKKIYSAKKDLIKETVEALFGNSARTFGSHSGLHLLLQLEGVQVTGKLIAKLSANGVEAKALTDYFYGDIRRVDLEGYEMMKPGQCLVLGFGNLSGQEIVTGLERIHQCVKDMEASNDTSI